MSDPAFPQFSLYRITLFYGPEFIDSEPREMRCVFNVKKRSWKGGVHVSVSILESQLFRLSDALQFEGWLEAVLRDIPSEERLEYVHRAHDLLAQRLCQMKLGLALDHGIRQEHGEVGSRHFFAELDEQVRSHAEWLKEQILSELDVASVMGEHFLTKPDPESSS